MYRSITDLLSFRPGVSTLFRVRGNCAGDLVAAYSIALMGEFSLAFNGALSCMKPETVALGGRHGAHRSRFRWNRPLSMESHC